MNTAVIYKSHYGSTESYAKWLAEELNADLLGADQVKPADLTRYQTIVYGGGLYAGSVSGIALLTNNFESIKDKALYLFTVGAADVTDPENTKNIRATLEKKLPPALLEKLHIFNLRGGMFYSKMNFAHRTMMKMMVKMMRKKPESQLRAEDKLMLETYGQDIDFTDRASIFPLVEDIRKSTLNSAN